VIRASTATYPHNDGLAGQTARVVSAGVRSLELIDDAGDSWILLDESPNNVAVDYNDGDATEVARFPASEARPGHYVKGRMVQDWSRFEVDATLHGVGSATPGVLRVLQVTSEAAMVDGSPMDAGQYEHEFEGSGVLEHYDGVLPLPTHSETAEAEADIENGLWAVYFPVDLTVTADVDATLEVELNLDRAFRWTDVPGGANKPDVYDIAPPLYEPVEQFGANRFVVQWIP